MKRAVVERRKKWKEEEKRILLEGIKGQGERMAD